MNRKHWTKMFSLSAMTVLPFLSITGQAQVLGTRPLLTVIAEISNSPYPIEHDLYHYNRVLFGSSAGGLSINEFFKESSRNQFSFSNAGTQNVFWPAWPAEGTLKAALKSLNAKGFDFAPYDKNRDKVITNDELTILVVQNIEKGGGANTEACNVPLNQGYTYCGISPFVDSFVNFRTLAHELTHALQKNNWHPEDLYSGNYQSLMSGTINKLEEDQETVYLDPYYLTRLGWRSAEDFTGSALLNFGPDRRIVKIRNPRKTSEYFLIEARKKGSTRYDSIVSEGILAWHVDESNQRELVYTMGPHTDTGRLQTRREVRELRPEDGPFQLRWGDDSLVPFEFSVQMDPGGSGSYLLNGRILPSVHPQGGYWMHSGSNWSGVFYPVAADGRCNFGGVVVNGSCKLFDLKTMRTGVDYWLDWNSYWAGVYYTKVNGSCPYGSTGFEAGPNCQLIAFPWTDAPLTSARTLSQSTTYWVDANPGWPGVYYKRKGASCDAGDTNAGGDTCQIVSLKSLVNGVNYWVDRNAYWKGVYYQKIDGSCPYGSTGLDAGANCQILSFAGVRP